MHPDTAVRSAHETTPRVLQDEQDQRPGANNQPDPQPTDAAQARKTRLAELGLADRLTISIPEAGRLLGLGISASYAAAGKGEIPYWMFGKKKRVFVDALLAMAELPPTNAKGKGKATTRAAS